MGDIILDSGDLASARDTVTGGNSVPDSSESEQQLSRSILREVESEEDSIPAFIKALMQSKQSSVKITIRQKPLDGFGTFTLKDARNVDTETFVYEEFFPRFNFRGHNVGDSLVGLLALKGEEPFQILLPIQFPTFDKMRKGTFVFSVHDFEKKYYTGLQVTKDPGVWYVYIGFSLMIIGCWIAFFMSHQYVFMELTTDETSGKTMVLLYGDSNKNKPNMKRKINGITEQLKGTI